MVKFLAHDKHVYKLGYSLFCCGAAHSHEALGLCWARGSKEWPFQSPNQALLFLPRSICSASVRVPVLSSRKDWLEGAWFELLSRLGGKDLSCEEVWAPGLRAEDRESWKQ